MTTSSASLISFVFAVNLLIFATKRCNGQPDIQTEPVNVQEVPYGETATLLCHSNDEQHNFRFWQLAQDEIVGPGNNYDDSKYNYEVLSGNLTIWKVSSEEEGLYHCVSEGVKDNNINIRSVRMMVKRSWAELDEHDPTANYFRVSVVVISLIVIVALVYLAYRLKRRHRLQSLLEASSDEEDDSAEEIFRAPGTSRGTGNNIVIDKNEEEDMEIPRISIDFDDILTNTHK